MGVAIWQRYSPFPCFLLISGNNPCENRRHSTHRHGGERIQFRVAPPEIGPFLTLARTTCWPFLSKHRTLARNPYSPRMVSLRSGMTAGTAYSNEIPEI
jgi:hypothetical protein